MALDFGRTLTAATSAIAGGLLVAASVAAELVHPVQNSDGTSREPLLHALYLIAWIVKATGPSPEEPGPVEAAR